MNSELLSTSSWEFSKQHLCSVNTKKKSLSRHSKHSNVALTRYRNAKCIIIMENHRTELSEFIFVFRLCMRNSAIRIEHCRFPFHTVQWQRPPSNRDNYFLFKHTNRVEWNSSSTITTKMQQQLTGHQWQPAVRVTVQQNVKQEQSNFIYLYMNPSKTAAIELLWLTLDSKTLTQGYPP